MIEESECCVGLASVEECDRWKGVLCAKAKDIYKVERHVVPPICLVKVAVCIDIFIDAPCLRDDALVAVFAASFTQELDRFL